MTPNTGVVTIRSARGFDATLDSLRTTIAQRGLQLFLDLDQQAAAQADGATMARGHLLLFGRPKAGTPILVASPEAGIELPLKAYVWEAADGGVFVSYADPTSTVTRLGLSGPLAAPLLAITAIVADALGDKA
jgi:uncharacterized protein (DUF302 family)